MRDILVTLLVFAGLPFALQRPVVGGLMWVWISVMNPHTQGWGFATTFPFAQLIAATTLLSVLKSREKNTLAMTPISVTLMFFVLWMNITTPFALFPHAAFDQWSKVMKIMLMTFVVMMVVRKRDDVRKLIWVLVISLGYYGVKGGIFTIRSGGNDRVWGPLGTFIGDNNALALALIMTIPLMYYLMQDLPKRWMRQLMLASMALCALAALGSYSRGGVLAIVAMLAFMWKKSRHKLAGAALLTLLVPLALLFMPQQWSARMDTITEYHADQSAMGRLNAWEMAYNLAKDRFFGGGYAMYEPMTFAMYAPNPADVHAAHSIYFQAMGEHGFIGLGLYLLLGFFTWRSAAWIVRHSRGHADLQWAGSLAAMIQASLIGFAVGGAFLSLLYWDVPYYLMAAIMATRAAVQAHPGVRTTRLSQIRHPAATRAATVESGQIPRRRPEV
ncbi:putative O-glycosylation ligase (exosortase A-associated) [Pseudoduganella flava]|uniref:O-glycosylation ligase, exosortase A system-associated n=1 Tax=Pseudoduganella flava TaxID=871742 RepID=A0A562PQA3_9BURK|nr:putative O-glycosylation ligase, exosortase A system-associated [Pseudoduganella flava]QGZ37809.1 putative O-glycosylation ligase, exosortase A system-associated [Pseudoduganella flava]TWI46631.1 putative O-glycosylation ligase (exosortase A-associated) [Pseudoduganella flava]